MADRPSQTSGEVQVLMLALLKENRDDTKTMIADLATIKAESSATKDTVAEVQTQLAAGALKFHDHDSRLRVLESRAPTPMAIPVQPAEPATDRHTRRGALRIQLPDAATMVKIGALIGALIVGIFGGKALG
jgi:hypothetical protein